MIVKSSCASVITLFLFYLFLRSGSNTKAVDARLTPKSSVNGLIPKDYTPVESLLSCAKGN